MMKKAVLLGQRSAAFLPEKRHFFPRGAPFVLIFRNPNRIPPTADDHEEEKI